MKRPEILARPNYFSGPGGPSMFVDEAIWGHRLYDEQTPWLAFLEFLNVLASEYSAGRAFLEPEGLNTLRYSPMKHLHLRNILFNNPRMLSILKDVPDDAARWTDWEDFMRKTAGGVSSDLDFSFLRSRFDSFEDFAFIAKLMRSTAIEGESNKRWSSKFVFPYGPAALYEDLKVSQTGSTNDRRFFGRVGEIVYLMLCRSGKGEELLQSLQPLLLDESAEWNRLVRAFSPDTVETRSPREGAYLPYEKLPCFEHLASDWLALLTCGMPGYDVVPHLVDLLGLHVILYKLRCSHFWASPSSQPHLVLEIIAPKKTHVRDLSVETYLSNNLVSREAIDAYIRESVEENDEWNVAMESTDPYDEALRVLRDKLIWPRQKSNDESDYAGPHSTDKLLTGLKSAAKRRHIAHVGSVHAIYAREIGLASRRGTRRVRYAPNDQILRSLVFAVVPLRMEFQDFLRELYERYNLIIGHRQAAMYIEQGEADQKAFEDNARRLEFRLASLGLLRRLSDACAYVHNPYTVESGT